MKLRTCNHIFDWDTPKAALNIRKHRVRFETAASALEDARAFTYFDSLHSDVEDRWLTFGRARNGQVLVVSHTHEECGGQLPVVRIISARAAKSYERQWYESGGNMVREASEDEVDYEIDWSAGVRGKYAGVTFYYPVYLDPEIYKYFRDEALQKDCEVRDILNELLKKEIDRREAEKAA